MKRLILIVLMTIAGCGGEGEAQSPLASGPLVNVFDWTLTSDEGDPFAATRPDEVRCTETSFGPEDLAGVWVYSIETRDCNWLTVQQKTAMAVAVGDTVRANVWHFELVAPEPASALVGVGTSEGILVQAEEPIPQPGRLVQLEFVADTPISKGDPIFFHVNNHGANSWHLVDILLNPPPIEGQSSL